MTAQPVGDIILGYHEEEIFLDVKSGVVTNTKLNTFTAGGNRQTGANH